jgi:hypothetical protein
MIACVVRNLVVITVTSLSIAQSEEGGERAKEGGEGRRVVGHVSHSVREHGKERKGEGCEFINTSQISERMRVCVGLHDKVEPTTLANIPYRFGKLLVVPVERKRHWGTVRIKRGIGAYVVRHEFHRRR